MTEVKDIRKFLLMPIDELRRIMSYNPETGELTWLHRPIEYFDSAFTMRAWNGKYAGKVAATTCRAGYVSIRIQGPQYRGHRLAWALYHGEWAKGHIDHINGDRTDNRIANLRLVSELENARNAKIRKDNTTGVSGVLFRHDGRAKPWTAQIRSNGKHVGLGSFRTREEAVNARRNAEAQYGYHPNHGKRERPGYEYRGH